MTLRRWNAETVVDADEGATLTAPTVRALSDGGYIVLWQDFQPGVGNGVHGQRYNADGSALGAEIYFSGGLASFTFADIDLLANDNLYIGNRVTYFGSSSSGSVYGPDGAGLFNAGSNGNLSGFVDGPQVSAGDNPNGPLVFAWFQEAGAAVDAEDRILLSVMRPDGTAFQINQTARQSIYEEEDGRITRYVYPSFDISVSPQGNAFIIASPEYDDANGIYESRIVLDVWGVDIPSDYLARQREFEIPLAYNAGPTAKVSAVEWLSDTRFVVLYETSGLQGRDVFVKTFDMTTGSDGTSSPVRVHTGTIGDQINAQIAKLPNGGFAVVWEERSASAGDGDGGAIRMKLFSAYADVLSEEFTVNAAAAGDQTDPSVTVLEDGRIVVSWTNVVAGVSTIHSQIIDPRDGYVGGTGGDNVLYGNDALADIIQAGGGEDRLYGLDGADELYGDAGTDQLNGGAGADNMEGGAGDDTYYVDNAGDLVTEFAGGGTDKVNASISYILTGDVEQGALSGTANLNLTGNAIANTLKGNAGANVLNGLAGVDRMIGLAGNDTYYVDNAGDVVIEAAGEGTDRVIAAVSYALSANIENAAVSGAGNLNLTGNILANTLTGNAGANALNGGLGADRMVGLGGNDTYYIDNAGDVVTEAVNAGTDRVIATASYVLAANLENGALSGAANLNLTGNALANTLTGNAGNNVLNGASGTDRLAGLAGNDTYSVDNAGDVVTEAAGGGVDTVLSSLSWTLGAELEKLQLTGAAAINGVGNALANTLIGNAAVNVLKGAAGNDAVYGMGGDDVLDGGLGTDRLEGGFGNDRYYVDLTSDVVIEAVGGGVDTVYASISFSVASTDVERVYLTGATAANIVGNGLANILVGNTAKNTIKGAAGDDRLDGGAGDDTLDGGLGGDIMTGGAGNDIYYVDSGGDQAAEAAEAGTDLVYASVNFNAASTQVERIYLTGTGAISALGNGLDNILIGNDAVNQILGAGGADQLRGGGGADRFVYKAVSDSSYAVYDRIIDLQAADRIDLSAIDARTDVTGNQAFAIVDAFTGVSGQITLTYSASAAFTVLAADINGDRVADMRIVLNGDHEDFTGFIL